MLWKHSRTDTKILLLATLLVFSGYGLLLGHSWRVATETRMALSANTVGVLAQVPENEVNSYVAELDARERALSEREAQLSIVRVTSDTTTLTVVTVGGAVLLGLILLNFYLDQKRRVSLT
jgi:hypothetical protein